jgi:hypothetical protein
MPKNPKPRKRGETKAGSKRANPIIGIPSGNVLKPDLSTLPGLIGTVVGTVVPVGTTVKPLAPGALGIEIPVAVSALKQIIAVAATQSNPVQEVWVHGPCELLVTTSKVDIALDDGLAIVTIPVSCDQVANATVQVAFAVGGKDNPAGMVMSTETRPRGPDVIVDVWGEALTAFAWKLLINIALKLAAQSGVDQDGAGLIPLSLVATKDNLVMLPIARHTFDRVQS